MPGHCTDFSYSQGYCFSSEDIGCLVKIRVRGCLLTCFRFLVLSKSKPKNLAISTIGPIELESPGSGLFAIPPKTSAASNSTLAGWGVSDRQALIE